MSKKVVCAMSGGVDSSVAALLLKKKGFEVVGVTMCLGVKKEGRQKPVCCGPEAIADARRVCKHLDIPHYVLDFSKEMQQIVIKNMVREYSAGKTPNPCVRCNESLKFGKLLKYAKAMGFDYLATGHYAKIEKNKGRCCLQQPREKNKDQTYFLYVIKRDYLPFVLFPVSDFKKPQVRSIAKKEGLPVAYKPQSQDLCFASDNKQRKQLFKQESCLKKGKVIDENGNLLAEHSGIVNYTIGQRLRLGVAVGYPLYVIRLKADKNIVFVGKRENTYAKGLIAKIDNWLRDDCPDELYAKIRYKHKQIKSKLILLNDSKQKLKVAFSKPQQAVAPGQSVVFYKEGTVYGGGTIEDSF